MGTPSTTQIGGAGIAATAGGGILSAFGALSSGVANSNMFNYQAAIAKMNQQIDAQNAEFAIQTGEQQATQSGLKAGQTMGQIKASQASAGFDVRSGSNKQVQDSQVEVERMNSDMIRSNAAKTAYNYQVQGAMAGAQASMDTAAAGNSLAAGFVGAGSSILGSAASVSSQWLQGQRVGLWNGNGSTGDGGGYTNPVGGVVPSVFG